MMMGIDWISHLDFEITNNSKSLDGEENKDLVFKEQNDLEFSLG